MSGLTNYAENNLIDWFWRGQAFTPPATKHFALLKCSKGVVARSTAYSLNDTAVVMAADGKYHLYKATTGGTTAASAPAYPGVANEVITDGTAVLTEQTAGLDSGAEMVEPTGGGYARVGVVSSLANFAGTQGAGTTTASTGTGGQSSNNGAVTFPSPTGNWTSGGELIWGLAAMDAASAGNPLMWGPLQATKTVSTGDAAPSFGAGVLTPSFA